MYEFPIQPAVPLLSVIHVWVPNSTRRTPSICNPCMTSSFNQPYPFYLSSMYDIPVQPVVPLLSSMYEFPIQPAAPVLSVIHVWVPKSTNRTPSICHPCFYSPFNQPYPFYLSSMCEFPIKPTAPPLSVIHV